MHSTYLLAALCGTSVAQKWDLEFLASVEQPAVLGPDLAKPSSLPPAYNSERAAAAIEAKVLAGGISPRGVRTGLKKRGDCEPESPGLGEVPGNGTVAAYMSSTNSLIEDSLDADTPTGYVLNFKSLYASTQQAGYLTYYDLSDGDYEVDECADYCNKNEFCMAFNIWYERDPSVTAAAACPNPAPVTNAKCALYGYPVSSASATNAGQYRGPEDSNGRAFQVVVVGSNGYSKSNGTNNGTDPRSITDFTGPVELNNAAILAPLDNVTDTYLGMRLYNDGPYDPSLCAATCKAITEYDRQHLSTNGTYQPCNFFNSFILNKNSVSQGTYCAFYTRSWDTSYAKNTGYQYRNDTYSVASSYTYSLAVPDSGRN